MIMNLRRGVTLEQLQDDLERVLGIQETVDETPELSAIAENKLVMVNGTGKIVFRSGGKLYELTATEV